MPLRDVTVIVVARERFSSTRESLESLYAATPELETLIYVDSGSPTKVNRYLEEQARLRGFTLVRIGEYAAPNVSRNIGLRLATTRYVVFVDNDVIFSPGWLRELVACARDTGAAVVGPLTNMRLGSKMVVHIAGGRNHLIEEAGRRHHIIENLHGNVPLAAMPSMTRAKTELAEMHAVLVRRDVFEWMGPFDEGLLTHHEHADLCLAVSERGESIYFEPRSVVAYVPAMRLDRSDLAFFALRWSERWSRATVRRFDEKWRLEPDAHRMVRWCRHHRRRTLGLVRDHEVLSRLAWIGQRFVFLGERCLNVAYGATRSPLMKRRS